MIGELQCRQIFALHKDGLSAEEISTACDLDVALVKLAIARNTQTGDRDITEDDLSTLRRHAVELALNAEEEGVQARMTMWLIERDKPKTVNQPISPVVLVNQAIMNMNKSYEGLLQNYKNSDSGGSDSVPGEKL